MSNTNKFYDEGLRRLKEAVEADEAKRYQEAMPLYIMGVEHLQTGLKYEKNTTIKASYQRIIRINITRAEQIKKHIEDAKAGRSPTPATASSDGRPGVASGGGAATGQTGGSNVSDLFVRESPDVHWKDVIGIEEAKRCLQKSVVVPMKLPHLFGKGGKLKPWKGILMYGPPGTGKTMLARAAATEANCEFMSVSCASVFKKFVGESEQTIRDIYQAARKSPRPCIIFFDEIDSIGKDRSSDASETSSKVVTEMLAQMDGLQASANSETDARVITIAATNYPWLLDGGLQRRFTRRIYIPLPDLSARAGMFRAHIERYKKLDHNINISHEQIIELAQTTEGYSAADITTCFDDSTDKLLDMMLEATHFRMTEKGTMMPCSPGAEGAEQRSFDSIPADMLPKLDLPTLGFSKLRQALETTRSSITSETLKQYEEFTALKGMKGQSK